MSTGSPLGPPIRPALDSRRLSRALDNDTDRFAQLLFAEESDDGFDGIVTAITNEVAAALKAVETQLSPSESAGLRLDTLA